MEVDQSSVYGILLVVDTSVENLEIKTGNCKIIIHAYNIVGLQ